VSESEETESEKSESEERKREESERKVGAKEEWESNTDYRKTKQRKQMRAKPSHN
jgi:hypothetical protein